MRPSDRIPRSRWRDPAILLVLQLSVCFVTILYSGVIEPAGDAPGYLGLARNVARGLGFTDDGVTAAVYRPPIFSSLLGFWFFITRTDGVLSASIFQSLTLGAAVVASYFMYLELFGDKRISVALAAVVALNPTLFVNVVYVMQEPVVILVTTVALWLTLRYLRRNDWSSAVAAGVVWGLATLAKVVTWFVPFLLGALVWHEDRSMSGRRRALGIVVLSLAVICPWTIRNYARFHEFIPVNGQGMGALEWFVGHGALTRVGGDVLVQRLQARHLPSEDYRRELWHFVFEHPGPSARQIAKNFVWFTQPYREWWGKVAGLSMRWYVWMWPALFFHAPLYLGLFLSGLVAWKEKRPERTFLVWFYLLYWGEHTLYWGDPRFALAVFPVLLGLGVDGLRRGVPVLLAQRRSRSDALRADSCTRQIGLLDSSRACTSS
jgi:4-amino-4-deoxy-L-arabinose transferase-like glycosyltransferase